MKNRVMLATVLILTAASGALPARTSENLSAPITCRDLRETRTSPRWLCRPMSRLVVNPTYTYADNPPAPFAGDSLSTDMAFYVGALPVRLPEFWSWHLSNQQNAPATRNAQVQKVDLERAQWQIGAVDAVFEEGRVRMASTGAYGNVNRKITVDLDKTPALLVQVPLSRGSWAIKVNDGRTVALIPDTDRSGQYLVDVAARTGWRGVKTFSLELWAIGGRDHETTISALSFVAPLPNSHPHQYQWQPHQSIVRATSSDGKIEVEATTSLPDNETVAQRLRVRRAGNGHLRLTGEFRDGLIRWDAAQRAIVLQGDHYHVAMVFNRAVRWKGVRLFANDWLARNADAVDANLAAGVWAVEMDEVKSGEEIIVAARFSPAREGAQTSRVAAQNWANAKALAGALRDQEAAWNRRLASVPLPRDFALRAVPAQGVTSADVRRSYGRAWVFLLADVLPPMPENGFLFPQCACGKPSLWADGAPASKASAQWESFLAMQTLSLVDPQTAWDAYEGQMTQIEADGSINGEGLPSCHAQTAWVLFQANDDHARLARLYPSLKKLLLWKISDPRWIFHGATPPGLKDFEFVVHALTDIDYALRIAATLGKDDEIVLWKEQRRAMATNFQRWFWPAPDGPMYLHFDANSGKAGVPDNPWLLETLILPPDILSAPQRDYLLKLFRATFAGDRRLRFPDYEYTWKGIVRYGRFEERAMMAETGMRDITRADEFSEDYGLSGPSDAPQPRGVRPSVFGARHAIDDVLWHNGILYDEGLPTVIEVPINGAVGASNLRVRGKPIRVSFGAASQVRLEGPGLAFLRLPPNFHIERASNVGLCWQGKFEASAPIQFEAR